MPKVIRRVIWEGACYVVECAVRADGVTSPASRLLDHLKRGEWVEDPYFIGPPDWAQITAHGKFLDFCRILAETGEPMYGGAVNDLRDGIWEFKLGARRLSFYDTPHDGTYRPKLRARGPHSGEYYWFPSFDEFIRLGHAFAKTGQKTAKDDLDMTLIVRKEDLDHDR